MICHGEHPKINEEVDAFVGMMAVFRSAEVRKFADEKSLEKAWSGLMNAFKQGGDYRSLRNLMTALHNHRRNADMVPGLVNLLDDVGVIAKKGGSESIPFFKRDYARWLKDLGDKPLEVGKNGDYRWFGAIAEAKIGRAMMEVPGFELRGWAKYVNGRKAMDLNGSFGGIPIAIEIKNNDLSRFTNANIKQLVLKVNAYVDQMANHIVRLRKISGNVDDSTPGKHVILAVAGTDPTNGNISILIADFARSVPELKGFTSDQVVFLGIRNGEVGEDALKAILDSDLQHMVLKLKAMLNATQK